MAHDVSPRFVTASLSSFPASQSAIEGLFAASEIGFCLHRFKNSLSELAPETLRNRTNHRRNPNHSRRSLFVTVGADATMGEVRVCARVRPVEGVLWWSEGASGWLRGYHSQIAMPSGQAGGGGTFSSLTSFGRSNGISSRTGIPSAEFRLAASHGQNLDLQPERRVLAGGFHLAKLVAATAFVVLRRSSDDCSIEVFPTRHGWYFII